MSGIYLVVWDPHFKDNSPILKTTGGGYPHITLAHTGSELPKEELVKTVFRIYGNIILESVCLNRAYVSSFEDKHGHAHHDVLLEVGNGDQIETLRSVYLKSMYPNATKFTMRTPHVIHGSFETQQQAEEVAFALNKNHMPYYVIITGIVIA